MLDSENFLALLKLSDYLCKHNHAPLAKVIHERASTVYVKSLRILQTKRAELAQKKKSSLPGYGRNLCFDYRYTQRRSLIPAWTSHRH